MSSKQPGESSKKKSKRRKHRESGFEEWGGYMAAKKQKLEMQFEDKKALELMDQKQTKIFKGICIFVNGHTDPPADDLKRLMLIHGGTFHHYSSSKTTHIIASNLPKSKMKLLKSKIFVTANWITDSIKAGKLLSHQNYLLYTPEVVDKQQRLDVENYFQKTSNSLSSIGDGTVKESSSSRNQNKNTPTLKELFGEDSDSVSSIDSEQNAQCSLINENSLHKKSSKIFDEKLDLSNHSKVSSPFKSSSNVSISVPTENPRISYNDSSHLKSSLSSTEKHTFNENSFPKKKNENKSTYNELFGEDFKSDYCVSSEQNIRSISVNKNSPHKKSFDQASYQKHGTSNHIKVLSPVKSSLNADISVSTFTTKCNKVSPMKFSSNVDISVPVQNQSIPSKDSSHLKPSSSGTGNLTFNESSLTKKKNKSILNELYGKDMDLDSSIGSEQNDKSRLMNKNSPQKKSSNASYQKQGNSNHGKVLSPMKSTPNVDISVSAFASNDGNISPLKSSSNVGVSVSTQNQSITNNDSSHSKLSSNINVSSISMNQNAFNKDSFSKPSKNGESPPKLSKAVKAGDPNFLPEFFNHSRKHHISTSAQELKRYVQFLVENNKEKHFPKRERLRELSRQFPNDSSYITSDPKAKGKAQHVIMHLDMDCFFVSVGLKKHPELRGVPVAVTHSKGKKGGPQEGSDINYEASHYTNESKKKIKGVISGSEASKNSNQTPKVSMYSKEYGSLSEVASCSYEARKAGVRNGLFLGEALRRCPNLQTIPYDFEGYSEVSKQLYDIVASYTLDIEAVSCDELYIDCTELLQDVRLSPHQFSSILRAEIEKETGCTASAGMGSNMLLARLATKDAKPNGQHYVFEKDVEKFMKQQKVGDLPGVGYATVQKLRGLNIKTCGDLQSWSLSKLQQEFGPKTGQAFYNNCRGKDDKVVQYHKDRKSVSAEVNYGIRFETEEDICNFINELSTEVQNRIRNLNCKGNQVTLKLMARKRDAPVETAKYMGHGVCDNYSKSIALKSATDSAQVISKACYSIARSFKINPQDYRGVGIQLSKLVQNIPAQKIHKSGASALKQSNSEPATEIDSTSGVFAPKNISKVDKVIPEKNTITHFLSNKSSSSEHLDRAVENNPVKNITPLKQAEPFSKHGERTKTIEHFLLNKPSTSRAKSYNITDYLPEELDQSVLEALPDDLKKEILESCKPKSVESERKSLNPNGSTSAASEQDESTKSLHQEQRSEKSGVSVDLNSLQTELIGLDQSFLNALPDDLRKEVLDSYDSISNKNYENVTMASTAQQPSTLLASKLNPPNSTLKKYSSNDSRMAHTILMTEFDDSVLNALPEDLRKEVLESYGGEIIQNHVGTHKPPEPSTSNQVHSLKGYVSTKQNSSKTTSKVDFDKHCVKKKPTLAGAVELDDVRALIKEWIDSTEDPLEEDVNDLKTFLTELCDVELSNVEILSKYLYRMAKKANQKWKDVYLTILSSVQTKVFSEYNSTLMLSSEFPK